MTIKYIDEFSNNNLTTKEFPSDEYEWNIMPESYGRLIQIFKKNTKEDKWNIVLVIPTHNLISIEDK